MFDNLLDDIAIIILTKSYSKPASSLAEWKGKLHSLSVCHKWRNFLLPCVYSQLFAEFKHNHKRREQLRTRQLTEFVPHYLLEENIELAVDNGYASMAKSMRMYDGFGIRADKAMDRLFALIKASPNLNIKSFSVCGLFEPRFDDEEDIDKYSTSLSTIMPQLTNMAIDAPHKSIGPVFYNLLKANADRLENLCLKTLPLRHPVELTESLTRLSISCAHLDTQNLQFSMDVLKTLKLFKVPTLFTWEAFAKGEDEVVFKELTHLSVYFEDSNGEALPSDAAYIDRRAFPYKLAFPKLKTLAVAECPRFITPLHVSKFPKHLDVVTLDGMQGRLICLDRFAFVNVDCLRVYALNANAYCSEAFYDEAEKLFARAFNCRQRVLVIDNCVDELVNLRRCTNLSRVVIGRLMSMRPFYTLTASLPAGCEVDIINFHSKIVVPKNEAQVLSQADVQRPCLASRIRVSFNPSTISLENASLLVAHMMCNVSKVPELIVPASMLTRLDDFAVKHMATHPFLLDVNLSEH